MKRLAVVALGLAGCNAIFSLDPPSGPDGGDDAPDAGDPDAPVNAPREGRLRATSIDFTNGAGVMMPRYILTAEFGPPSLDCQKQLSDGECALERCSSEPVGSRVDAGAITFQGIMTATIVPDSAGRYATTTLPGRLFAPGATVSLSASGAEVPAFAATLAVPDVVTFLGDVPSDSGETIPISRSQPYDLEWASRTPGKIVVLIASDSSNLRVHCAFPGDAALRRQVPASLLMGMPAGPGVFLTSSELTQTVPGATVGVEATTVVNGRNVFQNLASGRITLK